MKKMTKNTESTDIKRPGDKVYVYTELFPGGAYIGHGATIEEAKENWRNTAHIILDGDLDYIAYSVHPDTYFGGFQSEGKWLLRENHKPVKSENHEPIEIERGVFEGDYTEAELKARRAKREARAKVTKTEVLEKYGVDDKTRFARTVKEWEKARTELIHGPWTYWIKEALLYELERAAPMELMELAHFAGKDDYEHKAVDIGRQLYEEWRYAKTA